MRVEVRFRGQPLAHATIEAFVRASLGGFVQEGRKRTDAHGMIDFGPMRPAMWRVRMVHMPLRTRLHPDDWESFWAAATFGVDDPSAERALDDVARAHSGHGP